MQRIILSSTVLVLSLATACGGRQPVGGDDGGSPGSDTPRPPKADVLNVDPPPNDPCARWTCTGSKIGDTCRADFATLPPINASPWRCHQANGAWHCDGRSPMHGVPVPPPPVCSEGWSCEQITIEGSSPDGTLPYPGYDRVDRCSRPVDYRDTPPGRTVACVRGTAFSGTRCEIVAAPPTTPGRYPPPADRCTPGARRWCEGLQYDGWGITTCTPEGRWPTITVNGKQIYDCQELSDGRRPDTLCACYHFYPNYSCCERADCMVAVRDDGSTSDQLCAKSEGKLCDRCNPQKPECAAPGSACLVTNSVESFCGEDCSGGKTCPDGYECRPVKKGTLEQCVPKDLSCYY